MHILTSNYLYIFILLASSLFTSIVAFPIRTKLLDVRKSAGIPRNTVRIAPTSRKELQEDSDWASFIALSSPDTPTHKSDPTTNGSTLVSRKARGSRTEILRKLLGKSCYDMPKGSRDFTDMIPNKCGLPIIPDDRKLVLRQNYDDPPEHGILGKEIDRGTFGIVYEVEGGWSSEPHTPVVAKWFKYKEEGLQEVENLEDVKELIWVGIDSEHNLWAIMKRKDGTPLNKIQAFLDLAKDNPTGCKNYLVKVRTAIVKAHAPYLKIKGGPVHDDLNQENVLLVVSAEPSKRAPEDSETGNVIANLIDWGKIKWTILTKKVPDESDIEKIEKDLMKKLIKEYKWPKHSDKPKPKHFDFSDVNNC